MKNIYVIGVHHDDEAANRFIAREYGAFNVSGVGIESGFCDIQVIDKMKPHHPDSGGTLLDSIKVLKRECGLFALEYRESYWVGVINGVENPAEVSRRDGVFAKTVLERPRGSIALVGAGHVRGVSDILSRERDVHVVDATLASPSVAERIRPYAPEALHLLADKSLADNLTFELGKSFAGVQAGMKANVGGAFPAERARLERVYNRLTAFNGLGDLEFQRRMSTAEYTLGSLCMRAGDVDGAYGFTELCKGRCELWGLPSENASRKLSELESGRARKSSVRAGGAVAVGAAQEQSERSPSQASEKSLSPSDRHPVALGARHQIA